MKPVETKPFKKIKISLSLAILIAIVSVYGYFYFFFALNQTRQNVMSLTSEILVLQTEEAETTQIKKQLSDIGTSHSILSSYFVDANNPVPFEELIEGYGKQTNVNVTFQGLQVGGVPSVLGATLATTGTFADTYRFLALLESAPYELSINNIDLQSAGLVNQTPLAKVPKMVSGWTTNIAISVYSVSK